MVIEAREQTAVGRWRRPSDRAFNRILTFAVIQASRFIMRRMNSLSVEGGERFEQLMERGDRGLLTFSNHVSLFDDPLLPCNLRLPPYRQARWVAADAINFFGSGWKAWIFGAGKCVPILRGAGMDQPGFGFLHDRLREGDWVHIFPEGGRTQDPRGLLSTRFKTGIGKLMAETRPLALPFYHYGMHTVLPRGSKVPRFGKKVRMVFGKPIDCAELASEFEAEGVASGRSLWDALTARAYELLRELEVTIHPAVVAAPPRAEVVA